MKISTIVEDLNKHEIEIIKNWSSSLYGMNEVRYTKELQAILAKLPNYSGIVYRADTMPNIEEGAYFQFPRHVSATKDLDVAYEFLDIADINGTPALFVIKTYNAKDISQYVDEMYSDQQEAILPETNKYFVRSIRYVKDDDYSNGGYYVIRLDQSN